jgi:hypothetical protein
MRLRPPARFPSDGWAALSATPGGVGEETSLYLALDSDCDFLVSTPALAATDVGDSVYTPEFLVTLDPTTAVAVFFIHEPQPGELATLLPPWTRQQDLLGRPFAGERELEVT